MVRGILLACAVGCAADPTQVIIVVDTDLSVPGEIESLRITVRGPDGETQSASGVIDPAEPRTLAQTHGAGPLGPFEATVEGLLGDDVVLSRRATFDFQRGRRLTLTMHLVRSCVSMTCPVEETCSERGCRAVRVAQNDLTPWTGPTRLANDAGVNDGAVEDACIAVEEVCDTRDQDCDGRVDETFNFQTDVMNCGGCGVSCTFMNGIPSCQAGDCVLTGCNDGFADCDMDGSSCEVNTRTNPDFCGDCLTECRPPNFDCCDGVCGRCG